MAASMEPNEGRVWKDRVRRVKKVRLLIWAHKTLLSFSYCSRFLESLFLMFPKGLAKVYMTQTLLQDLFNKENSRD